MNSNRIDHDNTVQRPRRRHTLRRISTGVIGIALTLAATAVAAPTASATVGGSSGAPGPSQVSQGKCYYVRTNTTGSLRTVTAPPTVWARNVRTGWGNDTQRVRYAAFAVEVGTGRYLDQTGYSGMVWAGDSTPATWTGSTTLNVSDRTKNFMVVYLIEWIDNYGRIVGSVAQIVDSYLYYHQNIGPYNAMVSCLKPIGFPN
jgi:hypothetical protein